MNGKKMTFDDFWPFTRGKMGQQKKTIFGTMVNDDEIAQ